MRGTAFYVAEHYDKLVKEGVTMKKIEIMGPDEFSCKESLTRVKGSPNFQNILKICSQCRACMIHGSEHAFCCID
jgi:hypothetical protein